MPLAPAKAELEGQAMSSEYRVVFKGEVLPGFDPATVRSKAQSKLKTTPEQIERLFAGRPAVLKKGIGRELAERYVQELSRIGMRVELAQMPQTEAPKTAPLPPSSDLEKTQLADPQAMSRYLQEPAAPPAARPEVAKTVDSAPPRHDPERTLIANPEALAAYFKSNTGAQPAALATGGIELPQTLGEEALPLPQAAAPAPASVPKANAQPRVAPARPPKPVQEEQAITVFAPGTPGPFSGQAMPWQQDEPADRLEASPPLSRNYWRERRGLLILAGLMLLLLLWWWL